MRILCSVLTLALCIQLVPQARAQNPGRIQIVAVHGEGVINNVGQRSSRDPTVRVDDENGKPVAGASVVFTLPTEGPSGEFANGEKTLIAVTDARGEVEAKGLRVNTEVGRLQIHVNASYRGLTARTNITQFNMAVPGKRAGGKAGRTVLILLAIAGAAAGGGAALALRNKDGSPAGTPRQPSTPIGITPGAGAVGPPR